MTAALSLVFGGAYDRIADLGDVAAQGGLDLRTTVLLSPKDAFAALRDSSSFAGGEMSVSFYMTERSRRGELSDLVALPVWVSRSFRHSNIYVREECELTSPSELAGLRVGLPEYGMTMAVWLRGLFADEYGVQPHDITWVSHRAPSGLDDDALRYPENVRIEPAPLGLSPQEQLLSGAVDAWIGAGAAPSAPGVRRLFADAPAAERDYYARTGVFPVMHVLVLRRSLLEADPSSARTMFDIFEESKRRAQLRLWSTSVSYATLPWTLAAVEEQTRLMGGDPWPYGLRDNLRTLETLQRYMWDQGLLWDELDLEDYFVPLEPTPKPGRP